MPAPDLIPGVIDMLKLNLLSTNTLLAGLLASSTFVFTAAGQTAAAPEASAKTAPLHPPARHNRFNRRAELTYSLVWGVDALNVKAVESGEMIRFTYTVLDSQKAKVLNDKKAEPALINYTRGVKLLVPSMEKVGKLRQSTDPVPGKAYWMAFSNKGRLIKRGDRVSVVIGNFHADGLIVD
jgi:hypothetical protein